MVDDTGCPVCCMPLDHVEAHCACAHIAPDYVRPKPATIAYDRERAAFRDSQATTDKEQP